MPLNARSLQTIDRWLGVPICVILTVVRALFRRAPPDCSRPPRTLLVVKLAEQGSTVLAYPALRRAVELVGREHVYFIAFEENRFIVDTLDLIPPANVITISMTSLPALVRSTWSALRRLRALNLDAAVDMEFFSRGSAIITFLSGAGRRIGFHAFFGAGPLRGNLMTHRLLYNPHLHTTETFLSLVEAVSRNPESLPTFDYLPNAAVDDLPRFAPTDDETAHVASLLPLVTKDAPVILLNPNASDLLPLRRWPAERYVALARRLLTAYPEACVVFTGGTSEAPAVQSMVNQVSSERCISLAGRTTLHDLLGLYTVSRVLVTNDSGPAHFAAITPIRIVTLFGPETPRLFGARTPRHTALWSNIACSPCVSAYNNRQSPCRNNVCMQMIGVDQVFEAVRHAYDQARADL